MKIGIIDDEKDARDLIKFYIKQEFSNAQIIIEADSIIKGIEHINSNHLDVLFLDIEFPNGTGFNLLELAKRNDFQTVFVTAHSHYGIEAIKKGAVDYLLKPVDRNELISAIQKCQKVISNSTNNFQDVNQKFRINNDSMINIPTINGFERISFKDIIRCTAESNYTRFYLSNNKTKLVSKTLPTVTR